MSLQEIKFSDSSTAPAIDASYGTLSASISDDPSSQNANKLLIDDFRKLHESVSSKSQTEPHVEKSALTTFYIDGVLEIPGIKSRRQKFKISYNETSAHFDNVVDKAVYGHYSPKVIISLTLDSPTTKSNIRTFQMRPSADTVEGEILYTRYMFALTKAGRCSLKLNNKTIKSLDIIIAPIPKSEKRQLISRAKLFRKLLYIERVFGCKFLLPTDNISWDQARIIEIIFRGITEGLFATRGREIEFRDVLPSQIDITKPPFTGLGSFSHLVGDKAPLLGQWLETGPVVVSINNAELASRKVLAQIRKGATEPLHIKFAVLDNKIIHRFESYAPKSNKERKALRERLERFKASLYSEEPKELADLIDEPLAENVSANEAVEIVSGWLQYNQMPDRFCPQDPILEADGKHWRVPLWIVYASGKGDLVEDILVNAQTGEIVNQPAVEELRKKGLEIASKLLHVG